MIDASVVSVRKPDPRTAMRRLLAQARELLDRADLASIECDGDCSHCAIKQVEGFEQMLADWDLRLAQGVQPTLGDLDVLARWGGMLAGALVRAGALNPSDLPARASAVASGGAVPG